jgi:hypothetical protein
MGQFLMVVTVSSLTLVGVAIYLLLGTVARPSPPTSGRNDLRISSGSRAVLPIRS